MNRSSKKLPKDANKLAAEIVRVSIVDPVESVKEYLARMGRQGGLKGGRERAKRLTKEQRSKIANEAPKARWNAAD
jgi:hypothetical protein